MYVFKKKKKELHGKIQNLKPQFSAVMSLVLNFACHGR